MRENKRIAILQEVFRSLVILAGTGTCVLGLNWFLLPAQIAPGGFSGIATILHYLLGLPVGLTVLLLNIPAFLIAFRQLGRKFALYTLLALIAYSVFADILPVWTFTEDGLLNALFGGLLMGAGTGLLLLMGATTGGTDLVAKLIADRFPSLRVGMCLFAVDLAIIVASAFAFTVHAALYAVISLFFMTKILDFFTEGLSRAKAFLIITDKKDSIRQAIFRQLGRGVSELSGKGGYTGAEKGFLLCVVERAGEVVRLRELVRREDEGAFVLAWEIREVRGEGFRIPEKPLQRKKQI